MDAYPSCDKNGCKRKDKPMFGYTDGETLIFWICYACGSYQGSSDNPELTTDIVLDPEIILEMIRRKELAPIN